MAKMVIEIKNGQLQDPTTPDLNDLNNSGTALNVGTLSAAKSFVALSSIKSSAQNLTQSIVDARLSITENGLQAQRIKNTQEIVGIGLTALISPVFAGVKLATTIASKNIQYNAKIKQENIKASYLALKYNTMSSSGGRR